MAENEGPKLSKEELAALDFLIADAQASGGDLKMASWAAVAREVVRQTAREAVREAAREVVREVARRVAGGRQLADVEFSDERFSESIREELEQPGVSIDSLIRIRRMLSDE